MVKTKNLGITHIEQNQSQKEVTANVAFDRLDESNNDNVDIAIPSSGTATVSSGDFFDNFRLHLTGSPSSAFTMEVPNVKRVFAVGNETGKAVTVARVAGGGETVVVVASATRILMNTSADIIGLAPEARLHHDIPMFVGGLPNSGALLTQFITGRPYTFPGSLLGSQGYVGAAPASNVNFDLQKNEASIGTMVFSQGLQTASFIMSAATPFVAGDRFGVVAPSVQDPSAADLSADFLGTKD